jgi:hypothetical protein
MTSQINLGAKFALDSVRFFSCTGIEQVNSFSSKAPQAFPRLFDGDDVLPTESDYFFGVACVFVTYRNFFFEVFDLDEKALEALDDFDYRIKIMMNSKVESDWAIAAIMSSAIWEKLRGDGQLLLRTLNQEQAKIAPIFDLFHQIEPSEFRTSDEVRKMLL